jgi:ATP-dependent Clp protease ATP-binding subunit ClpC
MGFSAASDVEGDVEKMREKVLDEAKRVFKPEFLNRITEIVFFKPLNREHLFKITDLEIAKVVKRLKDRKITLEVSAEAKALLIEKGYDEKYGARPLRRAVERYLEDPLAEAILRGDVKDNDPIRVIRTGETLAFEQSTPPLSGISS